MSTGGADGRNGTERKEAAGRHFSMGGREGDTNSQASGYNYSRAEMIKGSLNPGLTVL